VSKLQIIVGSTRPERAVEPVSSWVTQRAQLHEAFDVEVLDLRDWPLPMFSEGAGTIGDVTDPSYSEPIVRAWNQKIAEGDAYVFITPEYNHSIPGVLKNAFDNVFFSFAFRNKPAGAVAYSAGPFGGVRAIEHLANIGVEAELVPLRNSVPIARLPEAFDDDGNPVDPMTDASLTIMLDDLAWWSRVLERARAEGSLLPAPIRLAAMAGGG
jgi:NAD(P)H-dependent FMN reductase